MSDIKFRVSPLLLSLPLVLCSTGCDELLSSKDDTSSKEAELVKAKAELAKAKAEASAANARAEAAEVSGKAKPGEKGDEVVADSVVDPTEVDPDFPTDTDWAAVKTEVTIKGSSARNCETKVLRGYLRVKCGANGDGAPRAVEFKSTAPSNSLARLSEGHLVLVHPLAAGTTIEADFSWEGASHLLRVNWPAGAPQPELLGTFGGAASVLDTVSNDPNVHVYTARIGAADHKNSQGAPLARAAEILRQDRANFHKFGKRDTGDSDDPLFTTPEERANLPRYLEKMPDRVARTIEQRMPLVRVEIDRHGPSPIVRVEIIDQGAPVH